MHSLLLPMLAAVMTLTISTPAAADQAKKPTAAETKQMSAPRNDHTFAMHMAHHHKDGIAMADVVIANGASDDVKSMARKIKADQQKDLATLEGHKSHQGKAMKTSMPPKDPDMQKGMTQLKATKGAEADRMFLELMIAHHASGLMMAHTAKPHLADAEIKTMAEEMLGKQAREIGELQRLRESNRSASK